MKLKIVLPSYDLSETQSIIIRRLLVEKPGLTVEEYSAMLNISSRTFYRYQNRYGFEIIDRVKTRHPTKDREARIFIKYSPKIKQAKVRMRIKALSK